MLCYALTRFENIVDDIDRVLSRHVIVPKDEKQNHKISVVLFFANSATIPKESPAVGCLGLHEITRIKADNQDTIPSISKSYGSRFADVITGPEHTEVFNIRVKREENNAKEKPSEIVNVPLEKNNDNKKVSPGYSEFYGTN
ncbi:hypothetical protein NQ318_000616 [Aromia moschata]|uniref:Uncharacterized protein n=1 Tax=Aromia moschata TaxID=1265417 RepID=A0AAV8XP90_9CUCU|nr:hypothetical protein NQ318_000616 [Aromia moschata]